jgi:hypothetical protein
VALVVATASEALAAAKFGATVAPRTGQTQQQAVQALESKIGRKLAVVRVFKSWNSAFPTKYDTWLKSTGHLLMMSVQARRTDGSVVLWRSIANAQPGSTLYKQIVSWAQRIKSFGAHMYFIFNHEPESWRGLDNGTAADFIAAWRKIVTVFRNQGVTNVGYTWTMTAWGFKRTDSRAARNYYPGDAYVDNIGADAYNFYTCRTDQKTKWTPLSTILSGWLQFGKAHSTKGMVIPEIGSVEDPNWAGRKADWIRAGYAWLKNQLGSRLRVVAWWHDEAPETRYPACAFWVDSTTSSLGAFKTEGQDTYYKG